MNDDYGNDSSIHPEWINQIIQRKKDIEKYGSPKTEMDKKQKNLFTEWLP